MTSDAHQRCTDRVAEAAATLEADIIVNVQGDEPLLYPEMFESLVSPLLEEPELVCSNMVSVIKNQNDYLSDHVVKAVSDLKKNIIYFSREPIPSMRKSVTDHFPKYKQLGLIAFRKDFLIQFTQLPPSPLEVIESVDMLRAIELGYKIRMVETTADTVGVDTPEDLEYTKILMKNDLFFPSYLKVK